MLQGHTLRKKWITAERSCLERWKIFSFHTLCFLEVQMDANNFETNDSQELLVRSTEKMHHHALSEWFSAWVPVVYSLPIRKLHRLFNTIVFIGCPSIILWNCGPTFGNDQPLAVTWPAWYTTWGTTDKSGDIRMSMMPIQNFRHVNITSPCNWSKQCCSSIPDKSSTTVCSCQIKIILLTRVSSPQRINRCYQSTQPKPKDRIDERPDEIIINDVGRLIRRTIIYQKFLRLFVRWKAVFIQWSM